jgi:hypothetical protein
MSEAVETGSADGYPDDNPKTRFGVQKPDPSLVPPVSILAEAMAFSDGAQKYGPYNWREKTVSSRIYVAAAMRHILQYLDGEDIDPKSGVHHLGHAKACLGIILDAGSVGRLNDNRPKAGAAAALIDSWTRAYKPAEPTGPVNDLRLTKPSVSQPLHPPKEVPTHERNYYESVTVKAKGAERRGSGA